MRKIYPYLQDSYIYNSNEEVKRRAFLQKIDEFANQRQYFKITLLNWEEEPIKDIEGQITSGSMSKDGSSAVRVTCSLTCNVSYGDYNVEDMESDFSINKKIFLEIGVKNDSDEYLEYPILWFPQGVFFISSFSAASSTGGSVSINISLKDKMAMLNGDVGGTLPALVVLDTMATQLPTGEYSEQKVLIYEIIQELVNHYGGEPISNIVIEDIPRRIRKIMKWNGDTKLYMTQTADNHYEEEIPSAANGIMYQYTLIEPDEEVNYLTFNPGDDVGYIMSDFVIPDELTANAGESVAAVLTRIKEILGNYEFFYDEFGIFHFREIKNYINTTQGKLVLEETSEKQYLVETNNSKSVYTFTDTGNITSINVTPQYDNIKNDYIVLGLRQNTVNDISYEVRYHLAIDEKPKPIGTQIGVSYPYYAVYGGDTLSNYNEILVLFSEKNEYGYTGNIVAGFARNVGNALPDIGNLDDLYYLYDSNKVYYWTGSVYEEVFLYDSTKPETEQLQPCKIYGGRSGNIYYVKDWRTLLYLKGKLAEINGTDKGYYYEELNANWPTVYNLIDQCFWAEIPPEDAEAPEWADIATPHTEWRTLADGNYYLDFINASTSTLGKYSVNAIGRRSQVTKDDEINCLFNPEIPNVDILNIDDISYNTSQNTALRPASTIEEQRAESIAQGQPFTQVGNEIYSCLIPGGYHNCAYDQIKYELYLHTRYQKTVSLTALPAFYLAPNSRVTINEKSTNTFGDYVINNIGITFGPGANMSVNANEVFERE